MGRLSAYVPQSRVVWLDKDKLTIMCNAHGHFGKYYKIHVDTVHRSLSHCVAPTQVKYENANENILPDVDPRTSRRRPGRKLIRVRTPSNSFVERRETSVRRQLSTVEGSGGRSKCIRETNCGRKQDAHGQSVMNEFTGVRSRGNGETVTVL